MPTPLFTTHDPEQTDDSIARQPDSDALRANLRETSVDRILIDPRQEVLRTVVGRDAGILKMLDRLLTEWNHPFRNWRILLPELRGFVLKQATRFMADQRGADCFALFCDLFLDALNALHQESSAHLALEGLTAYIEKMATLLTQPSHKSRLPEYAPAFDRVFQALAALPEERLLLLVQTHHPLRRTVTLLVNSQPAQPLLPADATLDPRPICRLAIRSLSITYRYWLQQSDPDWFAVLGTDPCEEISHRALQDSLTTLEALATQPHDQALIRRLAELTTFTDIVRAYRMAAERLGQTTGDSSNTDQQIIEERKLRFLFHIMETEGLSLIHEETLREINRSLVHLVELEQSFEEIHGSFLRAFFFLKTYVVKYPRTALQSIEVLGAEVFKHDNSLLVEAFLDQVVRFGFQYSAFKGVGHDWQPLCNPSHLYNIRVWLNLIVHNPKWSSTLFSALIINLKLSGVLIRDTDMFQKEVTNLLNSDIRPIYNLLKQFTRLLPVYYNEIGAEGELREVSTELDEISHRQDHLIHFLRKQCHVESTNRIVDLVQNIFLYWQSGQRVVLEEVVSSAILQDLEPAGPWFDGVHALVVTLCTRGAPLSWPDATLQAHLLTCSEFAEADRRRVALLIRLYHLLDLKYNLGFLGIRAPLLQAIQHGIPQLAPLLEVLDQGVTGYPRLEAILDALEILQERILSPEIFPAREEIYQKRHIAVDIPSVYGYYQELKFDALALSFRLENWAKVDLEQLSERIPETFVTRATFFRVAKYLKVFLRALKVDGVVSRRMENMCEVLDRFLELNQFSFHQYLDIFRNFSEGVKDIIHTYYTSHHRDNLATIITMIPSELLLPRYAALKDEDEMATLERISEAFLRDLIAETFGLQAFDLMITRIRHILLHQQEAMAPEMLTGIMTYDPAKLFCPIHSPNPHTRNLIHLGNKGFNLVELVQCGATVPAGVILTTEFFRCQEVVQSYLPAQQDFLDRLRQQVAQLEAETGMQFGQPERPLLLSVRSGALISMPGMMQTIHNVGINEEIVAGMARSTGNGFFAWDNYRRFIQSWSMSFNAPRSAFSDLMWAAKIRHGVQKKRQFGAGQMAELARAYHTEALRLQIPIPTDPWQQLLAAILQVIVSWNSVKAKAYRNIMDIADDWGTAVVLQQMVYGNLHDQSGSGVLFTAHPHRKLDRVLLWGDYTAGNQGEDIVGGLVMTNPISLEQTQYDRRDPATSLEVCFPDIYRKLREMAQLLVYKQGWNPQEIEFTFEGPQADDLYLLQSRDMLTTKHGTAVYHRFRDTPELKQSRLARGLGVSGGALCGRAVFNLEQIQRRRAADPKVPLILIRYDTVPDDIKEIFLANGLLTTRGGQTSHAAIVAARLEKTCVVGCANLTIRQVVGTATIYCEVGAETIHENDEISIDGSTGLLFKGRHPIQSSVVSGL
ncbi:MAG: phosphoenolpyruvate synthase [Magnetococcales bacterium]|nr:phosphoenolpyruvate synthase [Magnetococcales bacterium]